GGAGPIHACYVAGRLDSSRVIYPPRASVFSAVGTLVTPVRLDLARGGLCRLSDIDWDTAGGLLREMLQEGRDALLEAGIAPDGIAYDYSADMRYFGQQTEVTVPLDGNPAREHDVERLRSRFDAAYEALYGVRLDEMDVEVVSWRVAAHGSTAARDFSGALARRAGAPRTARRVSLDGGAMEVAVYDRDALAVDQTLAGPVIVEERETTIFVLAGWTLTVFADGCLVATRPDARQA
ncbi:MAG: hydantoinase/oxoprolinase family protein, partial [Gammaproteobacteria bacterium]